MTGKQPNIVLIIADQWSTRIADGSGRYESGVQTPGIDRLASEGIRFTQSYASFPLCGPARASMFTGLMPHRHRILHNEESYIEKQGKTPTRADVVTLGEAFKQAGYRTAYFGKEHAAGYGYRGMEDFGSIKYSAGGMLAEGSAFDPVFTRDAMAFLQGTHQHPFYMVLSLINPHDICKVLGGKVKGATFADAIFFCRNDEERYLRFQKRPGLPANHDAPVVKGMIRDRDYMYEELEAFSEDDWKRYIAAYCLLIENTDWLIGLVLTTLHNSGLEDDTIVIFTTDHGDLMGSHRLISKTAFYEESAKTMLLIKQPGRIMPGTVNERALIGTVDLMPTVLDLCDIAVPQRLDGNSFKALCHGDQDGGFGELIAVNPDGRMLRFDRYKYIRSRIYEEEYEILFDLSTGPSESTNLFGKTGYEGASDGARRRLQRWLESENLNLTFEPI